MQENILENIPEENIINHNIIILDNKITYYDLLYKKWCRKIDLMLKNNVYKIQDNVCKIQDNVCKIQDHENKINSLDKTISLKIDIVDKILNKLDNKNQKYDKIIELLIIKINKNNSMLIIIKKWVSIFMLIFMLIFVLFFIIIIYIIWDIYLEHYIN